MTVIINEFEIDVLPPPQEEAPERPAPPGPAPATVRDVLEQMEDRDQRLSAW